VLSLSRAALSEHSRYFEVTGPDAGGIKIASGMDLVYKVIFRPDEARDYEDELVRTPLIFIHACDQLVFVLLYAVISSFLAWPFKRSSCLPFYCLGHNTGVLD
jgi:hypothetical protein